MNRPESAAFLTPTVVANFQIMHTLKHIWIFVIAISLSCSNLNDKIGDKTIIDQDLKYLSADHYISVNKDSLTANYFRYFRSITDDFGAITFKIVDSKTYNKDLIKIFSFLISGEGKDNWSYSEKLVVVSSHGDLLFESDFRQIEKELKIPECGVPDYSMDSIYNSTIDNLDILHLEIKEYYEACGGESEQLRKLNYQYKIKGFELVAI